MHRLPEILAERRPSDAQVELDLRVPPDLGCFAGHFPGAPVLPGVVQIDWCVRLARERFAPGGAHFSNFRALEQIKFLAPILPSAQVSLLLESRNGGERLRFVYSARERKFSSGTIVFGA